MVGHFYSSDLYSAYQKLSLLKDMLHECQQRDVTFSVNKDYLMVVFHGFSRDGIFEDDFKLSQKIDSALIL